MSKWLPLRFGPHGAPVFGFTQTEGDPVAVSKYDIEIHRWLQHLPLRVVADLWGISVEAYNGVAAGNSINAGMKIFLRPQIIHLVAEESFGAVTENASQHRSSSESKIHEVQPKESLYAISKKYGVPVEQLKEWNNLKDNNLRIGQQLIISK